MTTLTYDEIIHLLLKDTPTRVVFTKADGSQRTMFCTRQRHRIPWDKLPAIDDEAKRDAGAKSLESMRVFDLEVRDWRSFRLDRIITIETSEEGLKFLDSEPDT